MPIYDKGDYIIKLAPPDGWSFEPSEVALSVDGETDMCSQGQDVDFTFQGFGVTGQVISLGSTEGPAGVTVTLTSTSDRDRLKTQVTTGPAGRFTFSPVPAGDYEVTASHPVWKLARHRTQVSVRGDNGDVGTQLAVAGFDVSGKVVSGSEPVSDVTFVLHGRRTEAAPLTGCDVTPAPGYTARSGLPPALCRVVSDAQGRFVFPVVPSGENSWKKLCEKLNAEFDSPGLAVQYALEFHQRIRRPGESLATFLYDLETLCARAYPEWEDATCRQRLVKDRFLMGIGEKSRKHILSFYQPTWSTETVLLEARKLEQIETSTGGGASVGAVHGAPRGEQSDAWSTGSQPQPSETSVLSAPSDKIQMLEEQMQACRVFRPSRDYNRSSRSVNTECVLGNDFLSLYGEVALDFVHMTMRLTENSTADRRVTGGRSLGERAVVPGGPAAVAAMESRDAGGPAAAGAPATDGHPVELTADVTIPAASEVLLAGRVRADTACAPGQHITLVEDSKFTRRYGNSLCVSSSVDVIRTDSAVQLRLCNPGRSAVKLYKSCTVARCVGYADPPTVRASPLNDLSREEREARERQLEDMVRSKVAESDVTDEQRRALAAVLLRRNGAFSVRGELRVVALGIIHTPDIIPTSLACRYVVVPFYAGARTRFDVRPTEVEVRVAQDSAAIGEPFQVAGYTISGRVLTSVAGGKKVGLGGATVRLDARSVVTEKDGSYTIEGANSGQFRLSAEADSVQFESRTVTVSPSAPQLPDLVAAAFQVCGRVDLSNLPDGVSAGPRSVEFKVAGSETAYTAVTAADGAFCTFLRPATYRLRVVVSEDERKRGLSFGSAQQELAVSAPVSGVTFSPFRARVSGAVRCLESCAGLQLTLSAEGLPPRAATAAADGRFAFDGVLPGQYEVTVTKDEWCWAASSVPVTVSAADVTGLQLIQSGYRLTLVTSHSTEILFRLASSAGSTAPAADYATLTAGSNTLCVPAAGVYQVEPRGCHQFQEPALRADTTSTAPLELRAVTHRVSGSVSCREATKDVRVRLTVETEVTELETRAEDGGKVHRFSVQARPGQVMTFQPQSDTMLFTPTYRQLTAGEDCADEAVTFQARKGTFISGRISPSLAGARITVSAADMEPVTAITDDKGAYQIGPLVPDRRYEVDAEKEGYVLTKTDGKPGHFEARKLAELRLRVTDEAGRPLPGVLLSVSGGKDYRRNSLTDKDGRQVFLSLSPGQYFIRPMMKEYEFTPASKMAEIAEGATLEVTVSARRVAYSLVGRFTTLTGEVTDLPTPSCSGRRVAYSLLGRVTTLTGDPEPGVVVEAVAGPQCDHHQEEATSEPTGALRIRGLRPQCEYTVRMKTGADTNTQFSRGIPDSQTVRVTDGDVSGFRLVAFRRLGEMDVTVRVVSAPQHLPSLRLVVSAAGSEAPLLSQPVAGSPLVVLPAPLARDGRQYIARLESSLSAATHTVRSAEVAFTADAAARHIELQFSAERRPVDAELGAGPVLGLPLTLLAVLLAVNQRKCLEIGKKLWAKYQARAGAGAARRESGGAAAGDGVGVIVRPVTVKVKARKV
ncbi:Nodal modulator 2 [Amphibalanus amphitrite]|uniref:Nodal modulator 2 n=1 Tax=Amphibalanus amphitrite TaxID=1232801 RepID=A0A6A4WDR7_AMPAM|nr:Nodal modulator 2 [Amphibalanus amphitrite]